MNPTPKHDKYQELCSGLYKFRNHIERVRYTFKSVELHRDLHFPEFLEQTFATLDWDGHVRGSMEDEGRRRSRRNVVGRRCSSVGSFVASVREQHVRLPRALGSKIGHRVISGAGCKLRTRPGSSVLALEFRAVARPGSKQRQMSARGITDDADPIRIHSQPAGISASPPDCGLHVFNLSGPFGFAGEPVLNRNRHVTESYRRLYAISKSVLAATEETSSVEMDQGHAFIGCTGWLIDVESEIGVAGFSVDDVLFNGRRAAPRSAILCRDCARGRHNCCKSCRF